MPSIEHQRWLPTIQAAFESVAVAPKDSLPFRSFALANPEALFVLQEAKERRASIEALKGELRKEFHLDLLPERDELLETKRTLADTGLFSIFSSRWRRAYHTHRSLCVSKPRKWTSSAACADVDRLLEMLRQTEEFNSDHQYQSKLGSHFSGLATNFDKLISVAQWLAESKSRLAAGQLGLPSPTFAKLIEVEPSTLLELAAVAPKLSEDFARISQLRDWMRDSTGFEILPRQITISEWHRQLIDLGNELTAAVHTILAAEPRPDAPLSEILAASALAAEIIAERERLGGDTRLLAILGSHFSGSKTDPESLERVLTFVDGIEDSSLPNEYKVAFTSFDSAEAFALIQELLAETLRHHRQVLSHLEELAAACAADVAILDQ